MTCSDLVGNCVVVGHHRPKVVLIVEPSTSGKGEVDIASLKEEILHRTEPFRSRLFAYERVSDASQIIVAAPGSLPRTTVCPVSGAITPSTLMCLFSYRRKATFVERLRRNNTRKLLRKYIPHALDEMKFRYSAEVPGLYCGCYRRSTYLICLLVIYVSLVSID